MKNATATAPIILTTYNGRTFDQYPTGSDERYICTTMDAIRADGSVNTADARKSNGSRGWAIVDGMIKAGFVVEEITDKTGTPVLCFAAASDMPEIIGTTTVAKRPRPTAEPASESTATGPITFSVSAEDINMVSNCLVMKVKQLTGAKAPMFTAFRNAEKTVRNTFYAQTNGGTDLTATLLFVDMYPAQADALSRWCGRLAEIFADSDTSPELAPAARRIVAAMAAHGITPLPVRW
jgi:hypothetical protein